MKKIFEILWFTIIYYRVLWHNRKYDDFNGAYLLYSRLGLTLSIFIDVRKDLVDNSTNIFEIYKSHNDRYYHGRITKSYRNSDTDIRESNLYLDSTFSNRKLVVKHLKSYNLI